MKDELSQQPDRNEFIKTGSKAGIAAGLSLTALNAVAKDHKKHGFIPADSITFEQAPLPYDYRALEPAIDAMTMEIHYTKHAATYAKNLADACAAEHVNTQTERIQDVLAGISQYSGKMRN